MQVDAKLLVKEMLGRDCSLTDILAQLHIDFPGVNIDEDAVQEDFNDFQAVRVHLSFSFKSLFVCFVVACLMSIIRDLVFVSDCCIILTSFYARYVYVLYTADWCAELGKRHGQQF